MPAVTVPTVTPLNASHPLTAIVASTKVAAVGDTATASLTQSGPVELMAGSIANAPATQGLTVAGIAAVCSALNTYYAALTSAQKAALGRITVHITPAGVACTVRGADVASFTSTLAGVLNTTSNYGPAGT
jgi:hypothetical protein